MVDVVVVVLVVEVVDVVVVLVVGAVVVASVESADSSTFAAVEATVDPQAVARRATTRNRQARRVRDRVRDLVGRGRNRGGVSGCISTLETNSRGVLHRPRGAPPGKSFRPICRSHLGFWT